MPKNRREIGRIIMKTKHNQVNRKQLPQKTGWKDWDTPRVMDL